MSCEDSAALLVAGRLVLLAVAPVTLGRLSFLKSLGF